MRFKNFWPFALCRTPLPIHRKNKRKKPYCIGEKLVKMTIKIVHRAAALKRRVVQILPSARCSLGRHVVRSGACLGFIFRDVEGACDHRKAVCKRYSFGSFVQRELSPEVTEGLL